MACLPGKKMNIEQLRRVNVNSLNKDLLELFIKEAAEYLIPSNSEYFVDGDLEIVRITVEVNLDKDFPPVRSHNYHIKFYDGTIDKFEQAEKLKRKIKNKYEDYLDSPVTRRELLELLEEYKRK